MRAKSQFFDKKVRSLVLSHTDLKQFIASLVLTIMIALPGSQVNASDITPIQDINTSPANFDGKEVKLEGIAKEATRLPLLNLKSFVLEDASGKITILTEAELPRMNEAISLRARVESIAIIKGESIGMTVIELERY